MSGEAARRNLVITRAGRGSLHKSWLQSLADRNFDLLVAAYDEEALEPDADGVAHLFIPGFKVAGWRRLFEARPDIPDRYDRVALLDDDLETTARDISACFDIGAERALALWQPSLTWDSFATFGATLSNPCFHIRHTNYVEMMCPFFRSEELRRIVPLFGLGFESGIDLVWSSLIPDPTRIAILDCIQIRHTRPVGGAKHLNGFHGRTYEDGIHACLRAFRTKWPSAVSGAAVSRGMREITSTVAIAWRTLALAPSILNAQRGNRLYRARMVADHIRHQFTRRSRYVENAEAILGRLAAEGRRLPP